MYKLYKKIYIALYKFRFYAYHWTFSHVAPKKYLAIALELERAENKAKKLNELYGTSYTAEDFFFKE